MTYEGGVVKSVNIGLLNKEQLQQAVELSDRIFLKQPEQPSMGVSFPLIFRPGINHSYGVSDGDKLVSFMGFVPFTMNVRGASLRVYSIGSVCTDPAYRGQRLAGTLLDLCMKHAEAAAAPLIFISGARSLYTRAGARHFGRAIKYRLGDAVADALEARSAQDTHVRPMVPEDLLAVHDLLTAREAAYALTPTELGRLLEASAYANVLCLEQQLLVAEKNGRVTAFAAIGVPGERMTASRPATLVEWAGEAEAASRLLAACMRGFQLPELVATLAWQDDSLGALLQAAGAEAETVPNDGTVYLADGRELLRQLRPLLPPGALIAEGQHGPYRYRAGGKTIELDDEGLLSLLFDPASPYRLSAEHPPAFSPIPLPYLSGLNYI